MSTKATVLVVEDNPINMELVCDLLESDGYPVLSAENAEEGIVLARQNLPGLILMDIALPGMDGLSATAALKRDPVTRMIPVIALTAHAMKGDADRAIAIGCAAYITKPIETRSFLQTLAKCLQGDKPGAYPEPSVPVPASAAKISPVMPQIKARTFSWSGGVAKNTASRPSAAAPRRATPLILVAHPAGDLRRGLEDLILGLGYDVCVVDTKAGLVSTLPIKEPDIVLLSPVLSDSTGADVMKSVRSLQSPTLADVPVLVIDAPEGGRDEPLRAVESGANDYIARPINQVELRIRIGALLQLGGARESARNAKDEARQSRIGMTESEQKTKRAQIDTLGRLAQLAECREPGDLGELHLQCVSQYCALIAQSLDLPAAEVEAIIHASAVHDIGLLFVPERIVRKKRPSRADRVMIHEHTTRGANFLAEATGDLMGVAEIIARSHHERFGGGGYPHGLVGEEIPLYGRICAVADTFDTFVRQRPEADFAEALTVLAESEGIVLDPALVAIFFRKSERARLIFERARQRRLSAKAEDSSGSSAPEAIEKLSTPKATSV
ncbi:MAG: response regulator [Akkermansiaceae bacterium]|nr:response regulator [Armatimonadota bacterium]